jgi:tetratricopeptide (TPR) repeat protein
MKIIESLRLKWILLIGAIVHIPMLANGFTYYSDDVYVLNNIIVHNINQSTIKVMFSTYFDGHYHPLTLLSLAFTYFFSGTNPLGYQVTNLALHLLNCWLIYKILTQLDLKKGIINLSALIFAIHPLNVESVARITERKDTQYVLFLLMAVYFFIEFTKNKEQRKYYFFSLGCFLLALLSKGQAVVFPLILYVIQWYQYKTTSRKTDHIYIAPLFILSGIFAFLNYKAQLVTGYLSETEFISIQQVIAYPSTIISSYLFKLFLPFRLSAQYPIPPHEGIYLLYSLVVVLIIAGIFYLYRRKSYLAVFGALLYIVSVFPMLRIIPVSENFMPDRYNYLGLMGFGIFFSALSFELADKYIKLKLHNYIMVWLVLLSLMCFKRTMVWKEGYKIWNDAYSKYPDDATNARNYGTFLISAKKDVKNGLEVYRKSFEINPESMISKINYMNLLISVGKKAESLVVLEEIKKAQPANASDISNRAAVLLQYGNMKECLKEFNKAVVMKPSFAKNRINRAGYYYNQFQFEQVLRDLDTLENLHSNYVDMIHFMRAETYISLGNPELAQKSVDFLKSIKADKKRISSLQNRIEDLKYIPGDEISKMSKEQLLGHASLLYKKTFYYQSYLAYSLALKQAPSDESLINNCIACAYNLARPDLIREYVVMLKANNYAVNADVVNYLKGLGITV